MTEYSPWWKGSRGEWYVVVQGVLFVLIGLGWHLQPGGLPEWPEPYRGIAWGTGIVLMLTGASLAMWGLLSLGPNNLTALPYPRDHAQLVTTGPYAIVRNPIYSGLIIAGFGWALWLESWLTLVFAVGLFVLFDLKTRREQAWLEERFAEYKEYCRHVKKLIPWVY